MECSKDETLTKEQMESILLPMLQKCRQEAEGSELHIPLTDFVGRVSYYTGIPETVLQDIEKKNQVQNISHLSPYADIEFYKRIIQFFIVSHCRKQQITYESSYETVNWDKSFDLSLEQLKNKLNRMHYHYRTIYNKTILMEDPDSFYKTYSYLDKINKLRPISNNIYYVGRRMIDNELTLRNMYRENSNISQKSSEYVLFYAISKWGYKSNLVCNHDQEFNKWIEDILLGQLEDSSVIILADITSHKDTSLSKYNTKDDMRNWLQTHNIPFSLKMNKAMLYELIKKYPTLEEIDPITQIIKANGHEVLRLPVNLISLSPTELMFDEIRKTLVNPILDQHTFGKQDELHAQILSLQQDKFWEYNQFVEENEKIMLQLYIDLDREQDNLLSYYRDSMKYEQ